MQPELFLDMARSLERACFDYILLEDSSYVGESFGGSTEIYLKNAIAVPRQDPSVVAALMTQVTSRIGIVPTFGTYAYHPYLLARLIATLDQVSGGPHRLERGDRQLRLRGDELRHAGHARARPALRHGRRIHGSLQAACGARGSPARSSPTASSGVLVDHTKVHAVNYQGKYFSTRGPLNSGPAPQGQPVIAQAGGSPRGRKFAAAHADTIVVTREGHRGDERLSRRRAQAHGRAGRNPDDCKVLFLINPILGETEEEAQERRSKQRRACADEHIERAPRAFRQGHQHRLRQVRLDKPLPDHVTTNGHQQNLEQFRADRQGPLDPRDDGELQRRSTSRSNCAARRDAVAARMGEVMEEVGGDGFLFSMPNVNRRTLAEIEDGLIPALQDRGLVRNAYEHKQFRDNLLAFYDRNLGAIMSKNHFTPLRPTHRARPRRAPVSPRRSSGRRLRRRRMAGTDVDPRQPEGHGRSAHRHLRRHDAGDAAEGLLRAVRASDRHQGARRSPAPTRPRSRRWSRPSNIEWDLAQLSRGSIMNLMKTGDYFEKIDYSLVDDGVDKAYRFEYGLEMLVWAQVMAYRTDSFKGAVPNGWADFWDTKKFPGDRAMVGTGNGGWPELEFALMAAGVPPDKLYPIDIDKAFASYDKIKKDVVKWWDTGAMPIQLLTDREVVMTSVWNGRMAALQAAGVPAQISWNQGLLKRDAWGIPKGAKNKANAMKFVGLLDHGDPAGARLARHSLRLGQRRLERVHSGRAPEGAAERARHQVAARQLQLRLVDRQSRHGRSPASTSGC